MLPSYFLKETESEVRVLCGPGIFCKQCAIVLIIANMFLKMAYLICKLAVRAYFGCTVNNVGIDQIGSFMDCLLTLNSVITAQAAQRDSKSRHAANEQWNQIVWRKVVTWISRSINSFGFYQMVEVIVHVFVGLLLVRLLWSFLIYSKLCGVHALAFVIAARSDAETFGPFPNFIVSIAMKKLSLGCKKFLQSGVYVQMLWLLRRPFYTVS